MMFLTFALFVLMFVLFFFRMMDFVPSRFHTSFDRFFYVLVAIINILAFSLYQF